MKTQGKSEKPGHQRTSHEAPKGKGQIRTSPLVKVLPTSPANPEPPVQQGQEIGLVLGAMANAAAGAYRAWVGTQEATPTIRVVGSTVLFQVPAGLSGGVWTARVDDTAAGVTAAQGDVYVS
jgi:hypothetical protein